MSKFLGALIFMTGFVHLAPAAGVGSFVGAQRPWYVGFGAAALFFVMGVGLFPGRALHIMNDRHRSRWSVRLVDLPYYAHWCACLFAIIPSLLATLIGLLVYGRFPLGVYFEIYVLGLVIASYGVFVRRFWYVTRKIEVSIEGLDPALDGLKIVQLSDLHVGGMTPKAWLDRWVKTANSCDADIAVVTGDMVTSGVEFHEDIADGVAALTAKAGTFVSMGNHDYFGEGEPLIDHLRSRGVVVLRNDGRLIELDGKRVYLAAIDDTWTKRDDIEMALENKPAGVSTILLAHDPERFPHAAAKNIDLTLAGHTHGGQIAMPFLWRWISLAHISHHYAIDLYQSGRSWMYVHPGLGTTGPPIRIGIAPAVVLLTLRAKPAKREEAPNAA
ncbi:MAG: metallophosphoesterase [Polyangiaceae bacterium]